MLILNDHPTLSLPNSLSPMYFPTNTLYACLISFIRCMYIHIHTLLYPPGTALLVGGSRNRSPVVLLGIFLVATDGTMFPGVDSASKNEYQDTPGVKTAGA
jgi:hypothetical protein